VELGFELRHPKVLSDGGSVLLASPLSLDREWVDLGELLAISGISGKVIGLQRGPEGRATLRLIARAVQLYSSSQRMTIRSAVGGAMSAVKGNF
jgi:hypothetical protein